MKILVTDDDFIQCLILKTLLVRAGHLVVTAGHGIEALYELHRQDFDLLVTDIQMPQLDGYGLIWAVRQLYEIDIIVVSSEKKREFMGVLEWYEKPVDLETIKAKISSL